MKKRMLYILIVGMLVSCSDSDQAVISGSGVFEGTDILVSSKSNGEIISLNVKEGDQIEAGDVIAQVDVEKLTFQKEQVLAGIGEIDINVATAKAVISQEEENYKNMQKRYQRIKTLYEQGSTTQQQMDDIETQYRAARTALSGAKNGLKTLNMKKQQLDAQVKFIQSQINDGTLIAPVSGVIVDKFAEQGEVITMGLPVVSVVNLDELWIKLYVAETQLGHVKLGDSADITIDSHPEKVFKGTVVWISPKAEFTPKNVQTKEARADLVYAVKITVPNQERILKIGMPADIEIKINLKF